MGDIGFEMLIRFWAVVTPGLLLFAGVGEVVGQSPFGDTGEILPITLMSIFSLESFFTPFVAFSFFESQRSWQ